MAGQLYATLPSALHALILGTVVLVSTAASAQFLEEGKSIKFGAGCQDRIKPMETGLGTCLITDKRARVWCPNGKVYERDGDVPHVSLVRSACGLRQIL